MMDGITALRHSIGEQLTAAAKKFKSGWEKTPTAIQVAVLATMIFVMVIGTTALVLHLSGNLNSALHWREHTVSPATRAFFTQSVDAKVWEIAAAGTGLAALGALGGALGARAYHKDKSIELPANGDRAYHKDKSIELPANDEEFLFI